MLQRQLPDLMLMNAELSGVSGLELLRRVRVYPDRRTIGVVLLVPAYARGDEAGGARPPSPARTRAGSAPTTSSRTP